ncbi:hypothetical protein LYB30171_00799 [Lysobacter luteus]|uniref:Uncharacterized protein n=2 Tax=Novilysobacter luteus TaxID=2822368 RepID=A0ABM8UDS7_9GAMM|nr:hypothetical protein LYB30171_00799 [Lysobacter luteus]
MTSKALGNWLKDNWFFIAMVALLFAAASIERGLVGGAWIAGAVCYVIAVMWFCSVAVPALFLRTRLPWVEWSLFAFASAFALLAYALGFPELIEVGLYGLATGLALGLFFLFYAWRLRAK